MKVQHMTTNLSISFIEKGSKAWDLQEQADAGKVADAENLEMACVDGGMDSGRPSVLIRLDTPDGRIVLGGTSLLNFVVAVNAFIARFGDPRLSVPTSRSPMVLVPVQHGDDAHKEMSKEAAVDFIQQYLRAWRATEPEEDGLSFFAHFMCDRSCSDCLKLAIRTLGGVAPEGELSERERFTFELIDAITKATPDQWDAPPTN